MEGMTPSAFQQPSFASRVLTLSHPFLSTYSLMVIALLFRAGLPGTFMPCSRRCSILFKSPLSRCQYFK